ncbi:MAG: hypothetical protein JNK82_16235 [Myxococcaceae bacterium]|nr:hypothetical protein [Myxococcaceae bacterium]
MPRYTPFTAIIGGHRFTVRGATRDEPGNFTLCFGEQRVEVDDPEDLLAVVATGEEVIADFGRFALTLSRPAGGRVQYTAHAAGVKGPAADDVELACWGLLELLGDERAPRACFFCRWSEVEPSTGWGNLGCTVGSRAEYDRVATSPDARRRKWSSTALIQEWVDEWHGCAHFEVRPKGYGYRGRP